MFFIILFLSLLNFQSIYPEKPFYNEPTYLKYFSKIIEYKKHITLGTLCILLTKETSQIKVFSNTALVYLFLSYLDYFKKNQKNRNRISNIKKESKMLSNLLKVCHFFSKNYFLGNKLIDNYIETKTFLVFSEEAYNIPKQEEINDILQMASQHSKLFQNITEQIECINKIISITFQNYEEENIQELLVLKEKLESSSAFATILYNQNANKLIKELLTTNSFT